MNKTVVNILAILIPMVAAVADAPVILFQESFDNAPAGKIVTPEKGKQGEVTGNCENIVGRFGNAIYPQVGSCIKFPAKGNLNPAEGTVEFWISPQVELADRQHIAIFSVDFGSDAKMKLYWHGQQNELVFWAVDGNDKTDNSQDAGYRFILPSGKQMWKKGQWHHVSVTWCGDSQRIYVDGKLLRHMYFDGGLKVRPDARGVLSICGDGGFAIDELRIWDKPRSPRKLTDKPSLTDAEVNYPVEIRNLPDLSGMKKLSGSNIVVYLKHGVAEALTYKNDKKQMLYGAVELSAFMNESPVRAKLEWAESDGRVFCKTKLLNKTAQVAGYEIILRVPILRKGMTCFIAADGSPFAIEEGRKFYDYMPGADRFISLPIASVYNVAANEGISIISPDDTPGDIAYDFGGNGKPDELRVIHKIKIQPHGSVELKWYFIGHEGDWRAALQKYVEINPSIMTPPQGPVAKGDQGMVIGGPSTEEFIMPLRELGVGWREVSLYLGEGAGFGNYIPDDLRPYMKAVNGYRNQIADMHRCGMLAMMYIQARECKNVQRALKDFSASVVRDATGRPEIDRAGPFGASMTARPGTKWFKHIENQAERILKTFPDCDGFFFDNAWSTEFADIMKSVSAIAHSHGKSLTSNGANWMSAGASDSIMAESAWYCLGDLQYLGLARYVHYAPIYGYGIADTNERTLKAPGVYSNLMRDIKGCLKAGASYGFNYRGLKYWPKESVELMKKYVVFQRLLHGRKWVLIPHALTLPTGVDGNVFELPNGRWLVTIVVDGKSGRPVDAKIKIQLPEKFPQILSIKARYLMNPEFSNSIQYQREGTNIEFAVRNIKDAAVVEMEFAGKDKND